MVPDKIGEKQLILRITMLQNSKKKFTNDFFFVVFIPIVILGFLYLLIIENNGVSDWIARASRISSLFGPMELLPSRPFQLSNIFWEIRYGIT